MNEQDFVIPADLDGKRVAVFAHQNPDTQKIHIEGINRASGERIEMETLTENQFKILRIQARETIRASKEVVLNA